MLHVARIMSAPFCFYRQTRRRGMDRLRVSIPLRVEPVLLHSAYDRSERNLRSELRLAGCTVTKRAGPE